MNNEPGIPPSQTRNLREPETIFTRRSFMSRVAVVAPMAALGGAAIPAAMAQSASSPELSQPGGFLDVRQFGAKGDGKTDDTAAIQKAIDIASRQVGGVFLPAATYACSELHLRANVALVGIPGWGYSRPGGTILSLIDDKAASLLNITEASCATIDGLSLKGNRLGTGIHGILLAKPDFGRREDSFRIERTQAGHFTGDGIHLSHVGCFSIRHCQSHSNAGDGVYCHGWDGFVMDNWFSANHGAGWAGRIASASVTMTANRIEWNRVGLYLENTNNYIINGNYFDRSGEAGICIAPKGQLPRSTTFVTIVGNMFCRNGATANPESLDSSAIRIEDAQGITVIGNSFDARGGDGGTGRKSPSYGIVYRKLVNCVIKDNVMHNGATKELLVDLGEHGEGVIVKDNPGCIGFSTY